MATNHARRPVGSLAAIVEDNHFSLLFFIHPFILTQRRADDFPKVPLSTIVCALSLLIVRVKEHKVVYSIESAFVCHVIHCCLGPKNHIILDPVLTNIPISLSTVFHSQLLKHNSNSTQAPGLQTGLYNTFETHAKCFRLRPSDDNRS